MYDSVGQFYPWRKFAHDSIRSGVIPLWNPYQFCGTPFLANSQSAVLYPGNLLFYLLPADIAAGSSVLLHLLLAAGFMYLFLRGLGAGMAAGVLAGIVYAFSTWQVAWLHLPTFLCTSCWLPLVLHLTGRVVREGGARRMAALGASLGMCLLAGHLQVAFYVLLAAVLYGAYTAATARRWRGLAGLAAALALGAMIAAPQVLPAVELSRRSHRAGAPTEQGFEAYAAYAVHPAALATLFQPDYYGDPGDRGNPYRGASRGGAYFNYAEGALYVGLTPLFLAAFALLRRRQVGKPLVWLAGLAALALLMAFGTFIDRLFYFYVPGFGSSGSPGRTLVLWAFAMAALAGLGYEKLASDDATPIKTAVAAVAAVVVIGVVALSLGPAAVFRGFQVSPLAGNAGRQVGLALLGAGAVLAMASGRARKGFAAALPVALCAVDLVAAGYGYNPTAQRSRLYPPTELTDKLKQFAGHDRIMPVNHDWSFAGPKAVLPPNAAMVYGLRDVQGYDSLFPGAYKELMNRVAGPQSDASPLEVGNMVFAKDPLSPLVPVLGSRAIVSLSPLPLPDARESSVGEAYVYEQPAGTGRVFLSSGSNAKWISDDVNRVELSADVVADSGSTRGVYVSLRDQDYPGWHVTVNGIEAALDRRTDQTAVFYDTTPFRTVSRLPAGHVTLRFEFCPMSFRLGLFAMLDAVLALAFVVAASRRPVHTVHTG